MGGEERKRDPCDSRSPPPSPKWQHSRGLFHGAGCDGVHCRNEGVTPKLVSGRAHARPRNISLQSHTDLLMSFLLPGTVRKPPRRNHWRAKGKRDPSQLPPATRRTFRGAPPLAVGETAVARERKWADRVGDGERGRKRVGIIPLPRDLPLAAALSKVTGRRLLFIYFLAYSSIFQSTTRGTLQ